MEICLGICAIIFTFTICLIALIGVCVKISEWALKDATLHKWIYDASYLDDEE